MYCCILFPQSASITPEEALFNAPASFPVAAPVLPSLNESEIYNPFILA